MTAAIGDRPLTDQQQAALEARDRSVSLSAGAGCGKTLVLTERFLAEADPTQPDAAALEELVAITFTDAAAREMRQRIRRRAFERLQTAESEEQAAAWQGLLRALDGARISTIHSFCTELLRSYAVEAGLDPQFEVLDAPAAELLKLETIDNRLRMLLVAGDDDTLDLAARRGLERLRNDLAVLAGPGALEAIERWRRATPAELVEHWQRYFEERVAPQVLDDLCRSAPLTELRGLCDAGLAKSPRLAERCCELAALLDALPAASGATRTTLLEQIVARARVSDVRGQQHWHDAADYERFKQACEQVRDLLKKCVLAKPPDFAAAGDAAAEGLALMRLVEDVTSALEAAKAERNQLEFDDLLVRAHRLLVDPASEALRSRLATRTRLLLVDEFQDTNPLQANIIKAFCGDQWSQRGLLAVGDFKQSIYRFTGAEPQVSIDLRAALPPHGRLSLTRNFRSQPAVTDFINAIFYDEFADYEPLEPARPQTTPAPAVEFMWTPGENSEEPPCEAGSGGEAGFTGEGEQGGAASGAGKAKGGRRAGAAHEARATEARWIARRLVQLLKSEVPLVVDVHAGQPRRLKPGDVAILLRSLSDAQVYEEALREHGLSYYLAGGHAFYSQQEIYDVLNLLRAVASNVDEIALAGALRSPLFALRDETLFRLVNARGSLNAALAPPAGRRDRGNPLPAELSADEADKVLRAGATLARLRQQKDRLLVSELLSLALELTGYDAVLLAEFLGPRKAANVQKLVEQARALDRTAPGDLQGFITQLSELVVRTPKEALAATQAEGDVIQIMTIHHAKGLEFPLVVLPDLDRRRHAGSYEPVLDVELGPLVPPAPDVERSGCTGFELYRAIENLEDLQERKRLLYVACTRAADYLLLSSSINDPAAPKQDWLQLVDRHVSLADGTLRRPLPPGFSPPAIRVTREIPRIDDAAPAAARGADLQRLVAATRELASRGGEQASRPSDPAPPNGKARRSFSFSQISGELERGSEAEPAADETSAAPVGRGRRGRPQRAVDLGQMVHAVLERIDLRRQDGVRELCGFFAADEATVEAAKCAAEAAGLIDRFLRTPRAAELATAPLVRREVEFLLPWPLEGEPAGRRFFHGFIDCVYQDPQGRWRLIDYKTNRIEPGGVVELAKRYEHQMLLYALACERALGARLAECVLAALSTGEEHVYEWSDAERRNGAMEISRKMRSLLAT